MEKNHLFPQVAHLLRHRIEWSPPVDGITLQRCISPALQPEQNKTLLVSWLQGENRTGAGLLLLLGIKGRKGAMPFPEVALKELPFAGHRNLGSERHANEANKKPHPVNRMGQEERLLKNRTVG